MLNDGPGVELLLRLWTWEALVLGLIVGSFANVCVHRLPRGESIVAPGSRCPRCGAPIRFWENVPLLSYVVLRGRCRVCRDPISVRYPVVELANGLLYACIAAVMGPTVHALIAMLLGSSLLILSLIDLDHRLLPDIITIPGIFAGIAASFVPGSSVSPLGAAAAAAAGYLMFFAVARVYRSLRGVEGLGQGDWKLAAMLGAFLGWEKMLLTVFLAALVGSLVGLFLIRFRGKTGQHALPLGTFLGFAGILVVLVGDPVLSWYKALLRG
jgi:leader peptidase (prepilin peptidase)/N-methyltransferase